MLALSFSQVFQLLNLNYILNIHEPRGLKGIPWTTLQFSTHNIWNGPHRAPLEWAGTEDHIDPEGLCMTPSVCEHLDHSLMNTGGSDRKIRRDRNERKTKECRGIWVNCDILKNKAC